MTTTAVLLLNFGEPENPMPSEVIPFLERIFSLNAPLMGGDASPEEVWARSRELAERRAPGLIEEYREIGGSPLHAQAREQGEALQAELVARGLTCHVLLGMQFTEPSIADAVKRARDLGADHVVALPVYPLAGPSTTIAAITEARAAMDALGWRPAFHAISGWHRHPAYVGLRADAVRRLLAADGIFLNDPGTRLVFSAHGTPMRYIEAGSGYEIYVRDFCSRLAAALGIDDYSLGYQNHTNRPGVEWTQPDIDRVIAELDADRVVVDAVSFMHEQSETLAELDHELREAAEGRGLEFHRVPVPFAEPAFISLLADLVEPFALEPRTTFNDPPAPGGVRFRPCLCDPHAGAFCMNPSLRA
jgi:ferrochelatase